MNAKMKTILHTINKNLKPKKYKKVFIFSKDNALMQMLISLITCTLFMLQVISCASNKSEEDTPPSFEINTSFDIGTVELGKKRTLNIMIDNNDANARYEIKMGKECFTFTDDGKGNVTFTSKGTICEQDVIIKVGNSQKIIKLWAVDSNIMDIGRGLLIKYVNTYEERWNDKGSGATDDATFWYPQADKKDGWYPLGSYIRPDYEIAPLELEKYPMILVKDSKEKDPTKSELISYPKDYVRIWDDTGSGADNDGSIWRPVCPSNYVALGGVVAKEDRDKPNKADVVCVLRAYTSAAKIGEQVYSDRNSSATHNVSIKEIVIPENPIINDENKAALLVGTMVACPGYSKADCDDEIRNLANFLLVPKVISEQSKNNEEPVLSGYNKYEGRAKFFSSVRLPFSMINALVVNIDQIPDYVSKSPFIFLQRQEEYKSIFAYDNRQGSGIINQEYTTESSFEEQDVKEFNQKVGLTVTVGGEVGFLGTGGSSEVSLSTEFGWRQETAYTFGNVNSQTISIEIPPGKFVEVVQITTFFQALRVDGFKVGKRQLSAGGGTLKTLQYPPNKISTGFVLYLTCFLGDIR